MGGLNQEMVQALRCPVCMAKLDLGAAEARCAGARCGATFPVVEGVPVLLNEARSLFRFADYRGPRGPEDSERPIRRLQRWMKPVMPPLASNFHAEDNLRCYADLLEAASPRPRVLIIGGRTAGMGVESVLDRRRLDLCETDVAFGPRTRIVCDAHDLPFADASFDGVVAQAVIEYLPRPQRAVEEIHRVLRPQGMVYAETPFLQPVHGGGYDFMRFTPVGHRALFRRFEEVSSGVACGPGMALASTYRYFLMSLTATRTGRGLANAFGRLTSLWLPHIDRWLVDHPSALDVASGSYFLGRRSEREISDREVVQSYRGLVMR